MVRQNGLVRTGVLRARFVARLQRRDNLAPDTALQAGRIDDLYIPVHEFVHASDGLAGALPARSRRSANAGSFSAIQRTPSAMSCTMAWCCGPEPGGTGPASDQNRTRRLDNGCLK